MKEQPAENIDNSEGANVTLPNNVDTLSIKQQRKEAADKLGISYKESLNMSLSDLKDPNYAFKQSLLEADKKIAEMQKENPEDAVTEIAVPPVEAVTLVEPTIDQPVEETNVIQLPTPEESANKEVAKRRKLNVKQLTAAALMAVSVFATIGATSKSNDTEKVSGNENVDTATANSQKNQATNDILGLIKYNPQGFSEKNDSLAEPHARDRMSTKGAFDGEKRNIAELDDHVLAKVKNNPSLMAAVLEVRESGNKEESFSLSDVNTDTRQFSVRSEHSELSAKGEKAVDTLERSWNRGKQGKLLSKSEVNELMSKYVFINHGTDEGKFKNSIDDTTYSAGVFDYRPDLGDRIYAKELGNGETVYFKVNERDPTRDCLNVQTLREKIFTTPGNPNTPPATNTPPEVPPEPPTPEEPPFDDDKKPEEAPKGHDNGNNLAPKPEKTTDQDLGGNTPGGNPTNPDPLPTNPEHTPPAAEPGTGNGTAPVGPSK